MKKNQYVSPETMVVRIENSHNLLDLSNGGTNANFGNLGEGNGDDAGSRYDNSDWDD